MDPAVLDAAALEPGNRLWGPAILEAPDTTTVVPPGWLYRVHETGAGILERAAPPGERS